jgi:hypothetical protein
MTSLQKRTDAMLGYRVVQASLVSRYRVEFLDRSGRVTNVRPASWIEFELYERFMKSTDVIIGAKEGEAGNG